MTYNKPEITNLGDAASVIRGIGKTQQAGLDSVQPTNPFRFVPAYDLDE